MKPKNKNLRLLISGLVCIVLLVTIVPRGKTILELSAQKQELKKQKAELQQVKHQYQEKLEELKTPEAIERLARERLGMIKDGEKVIIDLQQDN
ncbi:MAG: septum formation initiator family protein [Syntrophomonadaceae bacterium]|nr:septum formation initiator family protein [Syntrophomonadaceae bacterium]